MREGKFNFVVLMDKAYSQLKDLVVFINQNSRFNIFLVELEYYKYEDYEIIIPKLFGSEVKKDLTSSSSLLYSRKKWDENSFFLETENKLRKEYLEAIKKLFNFSKKEADQISWGTGSSKGSFNSRFNNISVRSLYSVFTDGSLQINFGWLRDNENTIRIKEILGNRLMRIKEFSIPKDFSEKWVSIPIENWYNHVDEFIEIIKDLIKK